MYHEISEVLSISTHSRNIILSVKYGKKNRFITFFLPSSGLYVDIYSLRYLEKLIEPLEAIFRSLDPKLSIYNCYKL